MSTCALRTRILHGAQSLRTFSIVAPRHRYTLEEAIMKLQEKGRKEFPMSMYGVNIKLNLDYRMKSNRILSVFELPHPIGKRNNVAVLCYDDELKVEALINGAAVVGDLTNLLKQGRFQMEDIHRLIVLDGEEGEISRGGKLRSAAKKLKLLPCEFTRTVALPQELGDLVYKHARGVLRPYETDHNGNVAVAIGQMRMDPAEVAANLDAVLHRLFQDRPDCFGTGPSRKKKDFGIFVLKMTLTSTQANIALPLDLDSFDILRGRNKPASPEGGVMGVTEAQLKHLEEALKAV